jgi:hypothetical protein
MRWRGNGIGDPAAHLVVAHEHERVVVGAFDVVYTVAEVAGDAQELVR